MRFSKGNPGRPKGAKNKVSGEAKAVIAEAARELGGVDRLIAWVREAPENERYFWASIYPKLLPYEATIEAEGQALAVQIVRFSEAPSANE